MTRNRPTAPRSLRAAALDPSARPAPMAGVPTIGLMTAACFAAALPHGAQAQTAAPIQLPGLEVESAAPEDGDGATGAGAPAQTATTAQTGGASDASGAGDAPAVAAGANPYADPAAPWKVDASANSMLRQPLVDTARTVTAIPKEVLEAKGATSVRELARTTPGLTLGTGEGGNAFGDVLFIRGFKSSNDSFIDGVRDSGVTIRENFMTEQVEILKGPSGTIAGRGVTGGAVNLVTKKPQAENFVNADITVGTDAKKRTSIDVNRAIADDFRVRFNAMWQDSDVAGRDDVYDDRWGAGFGVEFTPTEKLTFNLDYYHLSVSQMPDWGVPWDGDANAPATETLGVDRSTFYGVAGRDFQDAGQDVGTFTVGYDFGGGLKLSNRTRLSQSRNDYVLTAPSSTDTSAADPADWTANVSFKSNNQTNDVFANVTEATWDTTAFGMKHSLVFGVDLSQEQVEARGYTNLTSEDYEPPAGQRGCVVSLLNPDPVAAGCWVSGTPLVLSDTPTNVKVRTYSAYVGDTVELMPSLSVNAGLRFDKYAIEKTGGSGASAYAYERDDLMVNWNVGVTWKPLPNGTVYAAVATSTNPMGQELDAGGGFYGGLDEAGALLSPEKNMSFEIGTKWELFDDHLLASAALFRTQKSNARETSGRGATAVTTDTGEYYVQGVEFGVSGNITDRLSIFGGASFMQSEVTRSSDAGSVGADLANIAHNQFNVLARYQVTDDFAIGGQATWRGEILGGSLAATNGNTLPSFWRFDAMAEYRVTENASLNFAVTNLTDETYYDAFYRSGSPFVYVAPGRSAQVTLKLAF